MTVLLLLSIGPVFSSPLMAQALSSSVVTAGWPKPAPEEWAHLPWVGGCVNAVDREYDRAMFAVPHEAMLDIRFTTYPPAAIAVMQACLHHVVIATLPPWDLSTVLDLASTGGDTALVQAVVTRQLALVHDGSIHQHAAVLDTAVDELMRRYRTPAKTQLARVFMAQGDALGPAVLAERLDMHEAVDAPQGAFDPEALMAYTRERLALLQQVPLATLSEDQRQMRADILDDQPQFLHWVTWMKTGQEAEFQQWLVGYRKRRLSPDSLMGVAAPRVTGTYWFNTPQGGPPLVPVPGKVNLLIFINDPEQVATSVDVTALRHLQRDIPGLQIILITKTMGSLMGRSVVDHPDQEAAMIHTFFADSLGLPGILSVDSGTFQKLPTGQIQRNTSANQDRYFQVRVDAGSISSHILVDTRGRVVYETADENDQLAWIIRHLQAMAPGTAAASRAP